MLIIACSRSSCYWQPTCCKIHLSRIVTGLLAQHAVSTPAISRLRTAVFSNRPAVASFWNCILTVVRSVCCLLCSCTVSKWLQIRYDNSYYAVWIGNCTQAAIGTIFSDLGWVTLNPDFKVIIFSVSDNLTTFALQIWYAQSLIDISK